MHTKSNQDRWHFSRNDAVNAVHRIVRLKVYKFLTTTIVDSTKNGDHADFHGNHGSSFLSKFLIDLGEIE